MTVLSTIVHRLTASLAFLLRFSPVYEAQLGPLLEVLQAKDTLRVKLEKGGCGEDTNGNATVARFMRRVCGC